MNDAPGDLEYINRGGIGTAYKEHWLFNEGKSLWLPSYLRFFYLFAGISWVDLDFLFSLFILGCYGFKFFYKQS